MMKTLKFIVLLSVMLVNVTPYIKDGKVEWKANEAAAQYYTVEYDFDTFTYYCHDFNSNNPALYLFQSVAQCEALNNIDPFSFGSIINDYAGTINLLWENSFDENGAVSTECAAYEINGGYSLLNRDKNTASSSNMPVYHFPNNNQAYTKLPDGTYTPILGFIHTHPTPSSLGGHPEPSSPKDWDFLASIGGNSPGGRGTIKGKVIAENGIYIFWFEEDGSRTYEDPYGIQHKNQ